MQSNMTHSFSNTPRIEAPRSKFNRAFSHKTTFDAGWLIPFYWDEVLPGDTFNVNTTLFARLSTPLFPIMDNMFLDTQYFFVPYRLLWENWRKFLGEQATPASSIDFQIPIISNGSAVSDSKPDLTTNAGRVGALMNYLGIPNGIAANDAEISAMPFRAYQLIYNEWYRDQNLINSLNIQITDGPDDLITREAFLMRRGKRHDYFTSALPWPQKGDAVLLPLGTSAPVTGIGTNNAIYGGPTGGIRETDGTAPVTYTGALRDPAIWVEEDPNNTGHPNIRADLTNATAATINDIREAFQVQRLLERDARGGTRMSEIIRNHFGVEFYDVSYRPEYLGGGSTPVSINPVAQTANLGGFVGDLAAFGTAASGGNGFTKSFVEHGIVMGICSVRADLTYQQGLQRPFSRQTRYDFYWPSLAFLGEQEILNKEIYIDGSANDDLVFGYQERYAEYRYKPSMITGQFQSSTTSSLDPWHLSQEFVSLPVLGQTFIEENPPVDRAVAAPSEPHFIMDSYVSQICARPMPIYGVPGMIDHF